MKVDIRPYQDADFSACLKVMESNTPAYFDPSELAEFQEDLQKRATLASDKQWPYFVLQKDSAIAACGGYFISKPGHALLIWGMVSREEHKQGFGRKLLEYRLNAMPSHVRSVELDTTPVSFGFFQKFGFVEYGREKDGYGPGLDKVFARLAR